MTKDELIARANLGDIDAMLKLIDTYIDEKEWNEAIGWADKASDLGNINGIYKAANLHYGLMYLYLSGRMHVWEIMKKHAQAVQRNVNILFSTHLEGHIDLNERTYAHLLSMLQEAVYCEAVTCYMDDDNSDYERVICLLKDADLTREQTLCGICYFELSQNEEAFRLFNMVYQDQAYNAAQKTPIEEAIYSIAMFSFSVVTRMNGDLDKAVMILKYAIEGLSDESAKDRLQKELGRYQKKMFGGWKFS